MKECYAREPAETEVFSHSSVTDVILRKSIQRVEDEENGVRWECDEVQIRVPGSVTAAEVQNAFDTWWSRAAADSTGLAKARSEKLAELSGACNAVILNGVDVEMEDGLHHFSMGIEDQLNLMSLQAMIMAGQTEVAYHADGEECRFFTAEEFQLIATAATNWKLYHESYYNSMRSYINAEEDAERISAIVYGTPIPEEYQTDVLKLLNAQIGGTNE